MSRSSKAIRQSRLGRSAPLARLALRIGGRYLARSPQLLFASVERRKDLRRDLALRSAEEVADELGYMKGALMKLGQMASYVDEDMPASFRSAMARLQNNAPPMTPALSASVIAEELGGAPDRIFARWDEWPFAAASIGQVHRAITLDGRAVAVKVQYPGIAASITSDVRNVGLLRRIASAAFPGLDTTSLIEELSERLREEVDYLLEAKNQEYFAQYYEGHPVVHVPRVIPELTTARVLTSELVIGESLEKVQQWDQHERDMAAETIHRFVSRSMYRLHAFNGDPHPGNYLFHGNGRVSFLDFGLTKYFSDAELVPLVEALRCMVIENDGECFRGALERAGFLRPGAPVPTETVVDRFGLFYSTVLTDAPMTITPSYASTIVRRFFDARGPLAPYSDVPRPYVILQRINLGLYAVLGSLNATANWRRISSEMWPFLNAPASTPIGEAEARWERERSKDGLAQSARR